MSDDVKVVRRAVVLVALTLGLVLALGVAPAGAHAALQGTDPADDSLVDTPPPSVALTFDEPVSATTGSIRVIDPGGDRVDRSISDEDGSRTMRVAVDDGGRGTYTVAYRIISNDGHTITGSFVYSVGERTGAATIDQSIPLSTSAAGGIGRWLGYAGAVVAVGAALLLLTARRAGDTASALTARLGTLVVVGTGASALGTGVAVLAQTATTTGRAVPAALSLVPEVAGESRPVLVALLRSTVLWAATMVAAAARFRRLPGPTVAAGGVVAAAGLLAPVAGHPWTADPRALAVPVDALHLLAASVWLGMVIAVLAAAPVLADVDAAVRSLSRAAVVAATVVLVSGIVSGYLLLGSIEALLETGSGQLVIAKAAGFLVLMGLGWLNRFRLVPMLGRAKAARPRLIQVMRAEVVVGALVLGLTAGLVNQPPGRDTLAQPYDDVRTVDGVTMRLEITPARAGENTVHVYLLRDGAPFAFDALEVTAEREGVPARKLDGVTPISPDHASIYGVSLPTPGTWTLVATTVSASTPTQFSFEVPVR